jgi:flagella basal body P-ring formation protein FlgA
MYLIPRKNSLRASTPFTAAIRLVVIVSAVAAVAKDASAADICFQATAFVSTSTVRLRDIAVVSASDAALMTRLENVALAPAPAPGRRMRLDFAEIRSRLEATGIPIAELNYSGSSVVVVAAADAMPASKPKLLRLTSTKPIVPPAQIKRAEQIMADAVRRSMHEKHKDSSAMFIDVSIDPSDARVVLANAAQGFEIGAVNPKSDQAQVLQVGYQDGQGQAAHLQVQCVVSERPQVPVLVRSVPTGDVVHESDLAWQAVDSTDGLLTRFEDIVDKEAKRTLHPDSPIHADELRKVPLVRMNDIVTGIWKSGSVRITGQFKAKSDGGLGDVITLVKLSGRDQVNARVTDVHEAQIMGADGAKPAAREEGIDTANREAAIRRKFADRRPPVQTALRTPPAANAVVPAASSEGQ